MKSEIIVSKAAIALSDDVKTSSFAVSVVSGDGEVVVASSDKDCATVKKIGACTYNVIGQPNGVKDCIVTVYISQTKDYEPAVAVIPVTNDMTKVHVPSEIEKMVEENEQAILELAELVSEMEVG